MVENMEKIINTPDIEIREHSVKVGRAVIDREALEVIEDIQDTLGEHYRRILGMVTCLLIESSDDLPMEPDETLRLLQGLQNLGRDIHTLMWAVNPLPPDSGYSRRAVPGDSAVWAAAVQEPDAADGDEDADSGMQCADK